MTARFLVGDVFDGLATLADGSVDLVVTSPPFLALRSYLPADHPDKGKEIGSEPTPAEFIDTLLAVSAELRRVLAPHGSICVELGDTYAGTGGGGGDYQAEDVKPGETRATRRESFVANGVEPPARRDISEGWPLAKSKTLIPELFRIALAYGINPLTGQASPAGRWRVRNVVTWCRPNPPVGALGDKWRPATSDIVIACTSGKRYWDDLATRKQHQPQTLERSQYERNRAQSNRGAPGYHTEDGGDMQPNPSGAPLLDYWEIPPGGYPGSHYAVYPPALVEPLVKAMAPSRVCVECGEPSRRIVEFIERPSNSRAEVVHVKREKNGQATELDRGVVTEKTSLGFTDCGHNTWRPALILDPFAGSGTTLAVATGHGHDAIGIDLDHRNYELAVERIGPLMVGQAEYVTGSEVDPDPPGVGADLAR